MLSAVSNSGPLIHLSEINQINLLSLFNSLAIPDSVLEEVGEVNLENVKVIKVAEKNVELFAKSIKKFKLQKAEIDTLYLAKKMDSIFLTDDLEAREAANYLKIKVHGSLGIIALAHVKRMINLTEAKQLILNLYNESTLFLTKFLVDLAINELERQDKA